VIEALAKVQLKAQKTKRSLKTRLSWLKKKEFLS